MPVAEIPGADRPSAADVDVITAAFDDLPADFPPPPLKRGSIGARGEVAGLSHTRLTWTEVGAEAIGWDPVSGAAVMLRCEAPNGYDRVSPLRSLVHWSVVAAGGLLVHGACVGESDGAHVRGLLLLGEAGYGKSTTTLACVERGWVTCGDDAVAVFPDDSGWHAAAVYGAIKTKLQHPSPPPADLNGDATPATVTWEIGGTKRVHLLTSTDAKMVADRIELDALVLLAPDADPAQTWRRISAAQARTLAAPSTALSLPFERATMLTRFGDLAREVPGYLLPRRSTMARTVSDIGGILSDSQPRISVIIPVFDGAEYLGAALDSIVAQTTGRFQIIVVDDASPDDAMTVAEGRRGVIEAAGHRLLTVVHAQNRGIGQARATGLMAATESLIAFLDQDDTWPAERTSLLITAKRRVGAAVARGLMTYADVTPDVPRPWVREHWFEGAHLGHVMGAILADRSVFDGPGWINSNMRTGSDDTDWFLRVRDSDIPFLEVDAVVLERKVHDRNQSRRTAADHRDMFAVLRDHVHRLREMDAAP